MRKLLLTANGYQKPSVGLACSHVDEFETFCHKYNTLQALSITPKLTNKANKPI